MIEEPGEDIGPDPHLNQHGVRLTREQRRVLGITGLLIGLGLVLVVTGVIAGLPPGWAPGGQGAGAPSRIVISGPGRARVAVEEDGVALPAMEVALPYPVRVERRGDTVQVEARPVGGSRGAPLACTVRSAADDVIGDVLVADVSGVVRCEATLR